MGEAASGDFCEWPGIKSGKKSSCTYAPNTTSPPIGYSIKLTPVVVNSDGSSEKPYVVYSTGGMAGCEWSRELQQKAANILVERFDIECYIDFSAK